MIWDIIFYCKNVRKYEAKINDIKIEYDIYCILIVIVVKINFAFLKNFAFLSIVIY
jgi:hypothetical protein